MRKVLLVLAVAAVAVLASNAAFAKDMKGMWGPGVSFESLPVDVKFGISPKASVFGGVSFRDTNIEGADSEFGLGGGFEYALFGGDDFNFNFQPAIRFFTNSGDFGGADVIEVPVSLAAEVWMNDHVSVQAAHGIMFRNVSPDVGDSTTEILTHGSSVTAFRFRYWFTK